MLHVLFSISSFIQVSNNEARKCELNYTKHKTKYVSIYEIGVYTLCISISAGRSWQDCQHKPRNAPSIGERQGPTPLSMVVYRWFILRLK